MLRPCKERSPFRYLTQNRTKSPCQPSDSIGILVLIVTVPQTIQAQLESLTSHVLVEPQVTISFVKLMAVFVARGVADQFVVFPKLRRRPNCLPDIETGRLQLENELVQGYPRSGIHFRIVNRYGQLQVITIEAMEPLLHAQIGAVRAA